MFVVEKIEKCPPFIQELISNINKKHQKEEFIYVNYQDGKVNLLMKNNKQLMIRSYSHGKNTCFAVKVENDKIFCQQNIINMHVQENQVFLICRDPMKILYLTSQHDHPIEINLLEKIEIYECSCEISYPDVYLYGRFQNPQANKIVQINLETLNIKIVSEGKGYCPEYRKQFVTHFQKNRLYVFGGKDSADQPCQKLLWTFDFQKMYWFALQMEYSELFTEGNSIRSCVLTDNSALLTSQKQKKAWILQVHQSKLSILQYEYERSGLNVNIEDLLINFNSNSQTCSFWQQGVSKRKKSVV